MLGKAEIVRGWNGKIQNVYRREVLYQEVWNHPITEVAKKYAVSDGTIHKVCRSMEIPTPPVGYWAKKQAGQAVTVSPLPPTSGCTMKLGLRTKDQTSLPIGKGQFVASVGVITNTEEADAALQKQEEERRAMEERKKRYNAEVARTKALLNQAEDYDTACKIRAMVAAAEEQGVASAEWIAWAKAKADWYDPMVAAKDAVFGRRNHNESAEKKEFRQIKNDRSPV